jgi:iron complex transport system ATP-binding protein
LSFLECKGLSIRKGEKLLISNFDFRIESPFFLVLIGDNGSGKTSLLKAVLGSEDPTAGTIVNGFTTVAYLSQFNTTSFDLRVDSVVVMGLYKNKSFWSDYSEEDYKSVSDALNRVGLEGYENRMVWSLSGGEQQLVWLAQQLLKQPDLIVLDEPTAHLDIRNKQAFFKVIKEELAKGCNVICATHDLYLLKGLSGDYIQIFDKGIQQGRLRNSFISELYVF